MQKPSEVLVLNRPVDGGAYGLSAAHFVPDSPIGHLVNTRGGRLTYLGLVVVVSFIVEMLLALIGIRLMKEK